jgi:flagellar motor protein MotB
VAVFPDRIFLASPLVFDAGRATLRAESAPVVAEIAATLARHGDLPRVEIGAHLAGGENPRTTLTLSAARAEAVRKALVAAGVDPSRLLVQGYGDARPVAPEDTPEGRAKNERVELLFRR